MTRNLAPICPFYLPVKNKTAFARPVFKSGTILRLSRNSLYPIIRDSRNYKINVLFTEKSNEMIPAMDRCFQNIICYYFTRLLSLYMVPNHQEELSSLIPAIYQYVRLVPDQNAVLSSGRRVKKGEGVWVGVSKIKWFEISE